MKKSSIAIILLFFFLVSCGYKPIYLNKKNNFNIEKIDTVQSNRLNTFIKNNLNSLSNKESDKKISLLIDSKKIKSIASKDAKGNSQLLIMSISLDVQVYEGNEKKAEKRFSETFTYSNNSNKFNLSRYEKNIEKNLTNKIIKDINIYLASL